MQSLLRLQFQLDSAARPRSPSRRDRAVRRGATARQ
jgi:hypothetical protein